MLGDTGRGRAVPRRAARQESCCSSDSAHSSAHPVRTPIVHPSGCRGAEACGKKASSLGFCPGLALGQPAGTGHPTCVMHVARPCVCLSRTAIVEIQNITCTFCIEIANVPLKLSTTLNPKGWIRHWLLLLKTYGPSI